MCNAGWFKSPLTPAITAVVGSDLKVLVRTYTHALGVGLLSCFSRQYTGTFTSPSATSQKWDRWTWLQEYEAVLSPRTWEIKKRNGKPFHAEIPHSLLPLLTTNERRPRCATIHLLSSQSELYLKYRTLGINKSSWLLLSYILIAELEFYTSLDAIIVQSGYNVSSGCDNGNDNETLCSAPCCVCL